MMEVIDQQQRSLALDPKRSFAVTAPAGSGKTELLTKRLLTLLAQVQQPEEILAITFTRKAANEMRQRILQALQDGATETPTEPHKNELRLLARAVLRQDQQQNWQLLQNPNRLKIKTIDSFCMSLVQQSPLLSGIGGEASIADDPEPLYQEAARNLLARLAEKGPVSEDLAYLLAHLDNNTARIEMLFCHILAKREQWLRHLVGNRNNLNAFKLYLEDCLKTLIEDTLSQAKAIFQNREGDLVEILSFAAKNLLHLPNKEKFNSLTPDMTRLPGPTAQDLSQWQAIAELLLTQNGNWRARLTKNEGFPPATNASEKTLYSQTKAKALELIGQLAEHPDSLCYLLEIRALPSAQYDTQQWALLGRLANLLPLLAAELMLVFREKGLLDYQQITIAALEALGHNEAPTDIALLLDYQLKHILVDEFQDTSSAQFTLLERLTEGWQTGDGRTCFIVGDGMQSCYGFRDANVGLFIAARQFGIGGVALEPLDLQVNFRSHQSIVDWVNQHFATAFPTQDDIARGAVKYSESRAYSLQKQQQAVTFHACIEGLPRQREADQVVRLIQQTQQEAPADTIAILVRNRSHLRAIIPQLHYAGIRWSGVDIEPLAHRAIISDLLALTQALLNPADRVAWLAVLRAPWSGLNLSELAVIGDAKSDTSSIWEILQSESLLARLETKTQDRIHRLRQQIQIAFNHRARKPLRQWVEGLWLILGGPATANSSNDLTQVEAYFELLEKHERGGDIEDMVLFKAAVERIYAKPAETTQAVQLMTIHKAKGLEFDHVILPGLDRTSQSQKGELLLWQERLSYAGDAQLLISPISPKGGDEDPLYRYLKREQSIKDKLENTRLIYVAATRAIKQLSLVACINQNQETSELIAPAENSLLSCIWSSLRHQAILNAPTVSDPAQSRPTNSQVEFMLTRLAQDWCLPALPEGTLLSQYRGHEYQNAQPDHAISSQQEWISATVKQILMHIAEQGVDPWTTTMLPELPQMIDRLSELHGSPILPQDKQAVIQAITKTVTDASGRWLLDCTHHEGETDWRLSVNSNGNLFQLSIPLTFIIANERWIIAFDLNNKLPQVACDSQLEQCALALSQQESFPIKKAIYFPLMQHLQEL